MNDDTPAEIGDCSTDDRSNWDEFHFAVASVGFFVAIGGAVLSSVSIGVLGLAVFAWGLAYFAAHNDEAEA